MKKEDVKYNIDYVVQSKISLDSYYIECNEELQVRTRLMIPLKNRKKGSKKVQIIMMNPAKADKDISDDTVDVVVDFIYNSDKFDDYSKIIITNLFPIYEPDSRKLRGIFDKNNQHDLFIEAMKKNRTIVDSCIKSADSIIIAYGDCPTSFIEVLHRDEVELLLRKLINRNNLYLFTFANKDILTQKGHPFHPGRKTIIGIKEISVEPIIVGRIKEN